MGLALNVVIGGPCGARGGPGLVLVVLGNERDCAHHWSSLGSPRQRACGKGKSKQNQMDRGGACRGSLVEQRNAAWPVTFLTTSATVYEAMSTQATHRTVVQTAHSGARTRLGCGNVCLQANLSPHVEVAQHGILEKTQQLRK